MLQLHLYCKLEKRELRLCALEVDGSTCSDGVGVLKSDLQNQPSAIEKDPRAFEVRHPCRNKEAAE